MGARTLAPLATRCDAQLLVDEVATLSPYRLLEAGEFELYLAPASQMPRLLEEIGRLREESFRLLRERSEERRVGKEWVSKCRSRWSPCLEKKNTNRNKNYRPKQILT